MKHNDNFTNNVLLYTFNIEDILGQPRNRKYYTKKERNLFYEKIESILIMFVEKLDNLFERNPAGINYVGSELAYFYLYDDEIKFNEPKSCYYKDTEYNDCEKVYGKFKFLLHSNKKLSYRLYTIYEVYTCCNDLNNVELRFYCYYQLDGKRYEVCDNLDECFKLIEGVSNTNTSSIKKKINFLNKRLYRYFTYSCKSVLSSVFSGEV